MEIWNTWITAYGMTVAEVRKRYPPARTDIVALTTYIDGRDVLTYVSSVADGLGISSGMNMDQARRIEKNLVSIPVPADTERAMNRRLFEALGITCSMPHPDEILIRTRRASRDPDMVQTVVDWITGTYGISCKAATASTPVAARIGAMAEIKPARVEPGTEKDRLGDIPLSRLKWIDHRNCEMLAREWAIFTVGDLEYLPKQLVTRILGNDGYAMVDLMNSMKPWTGFGTCKRIDLPDPSNNRSVIRRFLLRAVDVAWARLSSLGLAVRDIHISAIRGNGRRLSTGRRFMPELEDPLSIGHAALLLLPRLLSRKAIVAVEVYLKAGPDMNSQLSLFPGFGVFRLAGLGHALQEIDIRYGSAAISRASTMNIGVREGS